MSRVIDVLKYYKNIGIKRNVINHIDSIASLGISYASSMHNGEGVLQGSVYAHEAFILLQCQEL